MMQTATQTIIDTQENVYFCKFDPNQDGQDAPGGRVRPAPMQFLADIKCAVAVIHTALRDAVAANVVSTQQTAENSRLMLDAVGLIDNVAFKSDSLIHGVERGAGQGAELGEMLAEVQQMVQEGATAASQLRALAYEHKARLASAACLLQKIGNRVTAVKHLMAKRPENLRVGDVTPDMQ